MSAVAERPAPPRFSAWLDLKDRIAATPPRSATWPWRAVEGAIGRLRAMLKPRRCPYCNIPQGLRRNDARSLAHIDACYEIERAKILIAFPDRMKWGQTRAKIRRDRSRLPAPRTTHADRDDAIEIDLSLASGEEWLPFDSRGALAHLDLIDIDFDDAPEEDQT